MSAQEQTLDGVLVPVVDDHEEPATEVTASSAESIRSEPPPPKKDRFIQGVKELLMANGMAHRALWASEPRATALRLVAGASMVVAPFLGWWGSGTLIDGISKGAALPDLVLGGAAFFGSTIFLGVLPSLMTSFERMSDNVIFEFIMSTFGAKMVTFDQETLGNTELTKKAKQVKERAMWRLMGMAKNQPLFIRSTGMVLITAGIVAWQNPWLMAGLVLSSVPLAAFEVRHSARRSDLDEELAPEWSKAWGDFFNLTVPPAIMMLQLLGAGRWFAARYRQTINGAAESEIKLENGATGWRIFFALLSGIGLVIALLYLIHLARIGSITIGELVFLMGAVSSLGMSMCDFASLLGQMRGQASSVMIYREVMNWPSRLDAPQKAAGVAEAPKADAIVAETPAAVVTDSNAQESASAMAAEEDAIAVSDAFTMGTPVTVEFKNVSFRYSGEGQTKLAVKDLSFRIKPGMKIASVGRNGAGKSTTLAMLVRQLRATAGTVLLNGTPIDAMEEETFRKVVVMLPQAMRHYNLTVRDLLNLARTDAPLSDTELWAALERTGAAEFVHKWDKKLDTQLGVERVSGIEPSGGQLQRMLLTTVLVAQRGLIILDEPVSMVDPEAAKTFWDALFQQMPHSTVIFSTHHLGAVRRADAILFIDNGELVAFDSHDVLMATCSRYQKLFDSQADDYR